MELDKHTGRPAESCAKCQSAEQADASKGDAQISWAPAQLFEAGLAVQAVCLPCEADGLLFQQPPLLPQAAVHLRRVDGMVTTHKGDTAQGNTLLLSARQHPSAGYLLYSQHAKDGSLESISGTDP